MLVFQQQAGWHEITTLQRAQHDTQGPRHIACSLVPAHSLICLDKQHHQWAPMNKLTWH